MVKQRLLGVAVAILMLAPSFVHAQSDSRVTNPTSVFYSPYTNTVDTTSFTNTEGFGIPAGCILSGTPAGNGNEKNAWVRFVPSASGMATADTFGSNYDTILVAYNAGFGAIQCNDDAAGGLQSQVSISVTGGATYWLMISSFDPGGGLLTFHLTFPGIAKRREAQLTGD